MKSLILISIRLGGNTGERAKLPESPASKSSDVPSRHFRSPRASALRANLRQWACGSEIAFRSRSNASVTVVNVSRKCAQHLGVTKTAPLQPLSGKASNESTLGYSLPQGRRDKTRPNHLVLLPNDWVLHVSPCHSGQYHSFPEIRAPSQLRRCHFAFQCVRRARICHRHVRRLAYPSIRSSAGPLAWCIGYVGWGGLALRRFSGVV